MDADGIAALKKKFAAYPNLVAFIDFQIADGGEHVEELLQEFAAMDMSNPPVSLKEYDAFMGRLEKSAERVARGGPCCE